MAEDKKHDSHLRRLGTQLRGEAFTPEGLANLPERMKTGFHRLDSILGGGLDPGLIVLGGSPGLGKSTLALNIAEHVSSCGTPVLFYSFEMAFDKVAKKLIVRRDFETGGGHFTVHELSDRDAVKLWSAEKRLAYIASRDAVAKNDNLYIVDAAAAERPFTAARIAEDVRSFMSDSGKKPLVIVDYLQILPREATSRSVDQRAGVEDSLMKMVALSHEGVPVILISSLSRSSYRRSMDLESFKETGSIEFSADVLLGLQFSAVHSGDADLAEEKKKSVRDVEVVVLKQRYGELGEVRFNYYAKYDAFMEREGSQTLEEAEAASPVPAEVAVPNEGVADTAQPAPALETDAKWALDKCYINNTMIARDLRRGDAEANHVMRCGAMPQKDIFTSYKITGTLSSFDCTVADAIYSLFQQGRTKFTPRLVLKALTGDEGETLSRQKRAEIVASIEKLRNTEIHIDCADEMRERGRSRSGEAMEFSGPMLLAENDGRAYRFAEGGECMPLSDYAHSATQVISFPGGLLAVRPELGGRKLSDTAENIVIKHFLIYRCEVIRNGKIAKAARDGFRKITFERDSELIRVLGIKPSDYQSSGAWKKKLDTTRAAVRAVLNYFRKIGYIDGYSETRTVGFYIEKGEADGSGVNDPWELFG